MREKSIQQQIILAMNGQPDVRMFRNNVGVAFQGRPKYEGHDEVTLLRPRRIKFGLCEGSPDLVGWKTIEITPEMVGQKMAVFVGMEVKQADGRVRGNQERFLKVLQAAGGIAGIVRSVEDAESIIE